MSEKCTKSTVGLSAVQSVLISRQGKTQSGHAETFSNTPLDGQSKSSLSAQNATSTKPHLRSLVMTLSNLLNSPNNKLVVDPSLFAVVTMGEAVRCWKVSRGRVRHYIDTGRLSARKSAGGTLISVQGMVDLFGHRLEDFEDGTLDND